MTSIANFPRNGAPGTVEWLNACIDLSRSGKFAEFGWLTPEIARALLARNPDNRAVKQATIRKYVADIRAGNWEENGETIVLSACGLLNNGQHRCMAVIEANSSIPLLFAFGLARKTRMTADQGGRRGTGDYLKMEGEPLAAVKAGIARLVMGFERSGRTSFSPCVYLTNAEMLSRVHSDQRIARSADFGSRNYKSAKLFLAPSIIGFCHYVFSEIDPALAETYLTQICRGEGLVARDPAYTVRDRLLNLVTRSRDQKTHIVIRGWNATRQGRKLTIVKIQGDENLPAIL